MSTKLGAQNSSTGPVRLGRMRTFRSAPGTVRRNQKPQQTITPKASPALIRCHRSRVWPRVRICGLDEAFDRAIYFHQTIHRAIILRPETKQKGAAGRWIDEASFITAPGIEGGQIGSLRVEQINYRLACTPGRTSAFEFELISPTYMLSALTVCPGDG